MQQEGILGNMWLRRPLRVNELLKKRQDCVWYHNVISLNDHRLVGTFQFCTTEINKGNTPDAK